MHSTGEVNPLVRARAASLNFSPPGIGEDSFAADCGDRQHHTSSPGTRGHFRPAGPQRSFCRQPPICYGIRMDDQAFGPGRAHRPGWLAGRSVPVDFGGLQDLPFAPFLPEWTGQPAITRFHAMAEAHGGKVAIDDGATSPTYAEVRATAAAALLDNTAAFPVAFLTCLMTGRTIVPVDASYPPDRQGAILQECGAAALIVGPGLQPPAGRWRAGVAGAARRQDMPLPGGAPRPRHPHRVRFRLAPGPSGQGRRTPAGHPGARRQLVAGAGDVCAPDGFAGVR